MNLELGRRIAFTLGALLVFRLGSYIPLPGIDMANLSRSLNPSSSGLLGMFKLFSAGGFRRITIFELGIYPYIIAAILLQVIMIGSSRLRALNKQGERGRRKIVAYTRYLTVALVAFQAYGIAIELERSPGVIIPGPLFELSTVLTLSAGTLLLVWLAEQITARGIGNGLVLILAAGVLGHVPANFAELLELGSLGVLPPNFVLVEIVVMVGLTAMIAFVEGARRNILLDYPKREIGGRIVEAVSAPLPLKLNNAGIIPIVLANWLIALPVSVMSIVLAPGSFGGANVFVAQLQHGRALFMVLNAALIILFTLFYAAFLLDPETASEKLKTLGGAVRAVAPGEATASYFDGVMSRIALVGGLYLASVFLIPELLVAFFHLPFYFRGESLLFAVCATLDIVAELKQSVQFRQLAQLQLGGQRL